MCSLFFDISDKVIYANVSSSLAHIRARITLKCFELLELDSEPQTFVKSLKMSRLISMIRYLQGSVYDKFLCEEPVKKEKLKPQMKLSVSK